MKQPMRLIFALPMLFTVVSIALSGCTTASSETVATATDTAVDEPMTAPTYCAAGEAPTTDTGAGIVKPAEVFAVDTLTDSIFASMQGKSYHSFSPVGRSHLRIVRITYYDFADSLRYGSIVCHKQIADDLKEIFHELYLNHYPIASVTPIDAFGGDDDASMAQNNTSCYNCRRTTGGSRMSRHAYGMAIDINPVQNPYVRGRRVCPEAGRPYVSRSTLRPGMITHSDLCYRLFRRHGFTWGGDWRSSKDYQHFEKRVGNR